jgi:hypothetical protein
MSLLVLACVFASIFAFPAAAQGLKDIAHPDEQEQHRELRLENESRMVENQRNTPGSDSPYSQDRQSAVPFSFSRPCIFVNGVCR